MGFGVVYHIASCSLSKQTKILLNRYAVYSIGTDATEIDEMKSDE
jgi:hypothetical protein